MRKRIFRSLITLGIGIILHCDGSNLTKAQCYESHHCESNYNSCVLKQSLTASNSFSGTSSVSVPATTFPPSSPSTSSEDEPNDTFLQGSESASGVYSGPVDSYLLNASLSSSSDKDIFAFSPDYQASVYFKTQGSASCAIYWQNHYGLDMPDTVVPDSYFHFVANLNTTSQNLEILAQGGNYFFLCTGGSAGSYSIQTDPGPNARNQYIQFHSSGSSGGLGVNAFEVYGISNCSQAHDVCVSACDKKFLY
ncbi:hypothetical protein EHQ61_04760 [Leptospira wolffii]|uniref:hypothetical protein n=1 Tax=Leptospira wolffii TaxID=409998 RepID=UPI00108296F7|nr:hypothetical protein [Leptospira wolffii]TGL53178.1 hypothetical protein EHQ61_04760 [Leptospira wolffii]